MTHRTPALIAVLCSAALLTAAAPALADSHVAAPHSADSPADSPSDSPGGSLADSHGADSHRADSAPAHSTAADSTAADSTQADSTLAHSARADPRATGPGADRLLGLGDPPPTAPVVPGRYADHQRIDWAPCFRRVPPGLPPGSNRLECGHFTAPMDWHQPFDGRSVTIAVTRLRPEHGTAQRSLLTNPGGPGGPGRTLPLVFLAQNRRAVLDNDEVIGIDVRGTGASSDIICAGGTDIGSRLDPRDRDPGNLDLLLDSAALTAKFCQNRAGDLGRLVNTEQTVDDLDLLRALLGRDTIDWLGYSGGTWLGAYYATYFPTRVGRFVLDSNAEFTRSWQDSFALQPMGFQRRFDQDFLPWAARYDALYHLGRTAGDVGAAYERIRAALAARPVTYPKAGDVDADALDAAAAEALYSRAKFPRLAQALSVLSGLVADPGQPFDRAAAARAAEVLDLGDDEPRLRSSRSLDASSAVFYAIRCNDTSWQTSRTELIAESGELGSKYPLQGYGSIGEPCAFWNRAPLTLRTPNGAGVPPILMVQDTHDPATPYEGAVTAHREFTGSRLLTVDGQGDHGVYAFGNGCVDAEVERYLVDGMVPPTESHCPGVPLPDPLGKAAPAAGPLDLAEQFTRAAGRFPR